VPRAVECGKVGEDGAESYHRSTLPPFAHRLIRSLSLQQEPQPQK